MQRALRVFFMGFLGALSLWRQRSAATKPESFGVMRHSQDLRSAVLNRIQFDRLILEVASWQAAGGCTPLARVFGVFIEKTLTKTAELSAGSFPQPRL